VLKWRALVCLSLDCRLHPTLLQVAIGLTIWAVEGIKRGLSCPFAYQRGLGPVTGVSIGPRCGEVSCGACACVYVLEEDTLYLLTGPLQTWSKSGLDHLFPPFYNPQPEPVSHMFAKYCLPASDNMPEPN
jgi:hypothetical protein